ncbi:hypothetical protein, partial [Methanobacterium sp.]|uniref:hypothetical protein n=1 Tax=Methanobacterium sp. TaxID=2164 RepID=UPI003C72C665
HIFITNPPSRDILEDYIDDPDIMERFIIDGPYSDLSPVYGTADFLIETIPIAGGLIRLEAMACSLPIVAFHNEKFPLFTGHTKLPPEYYFIGSTKDEILYYSSKLIKNFELRKKIGNELYNYYFHEFSPKKIREALCNVITDNNSPSIREDKKYSCNYDLEYAQIYQSNVNFEPYKKLFLQSILKESSFPFAERINFYFKGLKNNEFKSKKLILMYALLSVIGWNGLSILNERLNNHNYVENDYGSIFKFMKYFKLPKS